MKASVYDTKGKEVGSVELPESVFGAKRNDTLVAQVVNGPGYNQTYLPLFLPLVGVNYDSVDYAGYSPIFSPA